MKYMLMFCSNPDDPDRSENLNEAGKRAMYGRVAAWFEKHGARTQSGERLQAPSMATTVQLRPGQKPELRDGPFIEGKELIGYAIVDVESLDEAVSMAMDWPAQSMVEVRPVLEMPR